MQKAEINPGASIDNAEGDVDVREPDALLEAQNIRQYNIKRKTRTPVIALEHILYHQGLFNNVSVTAEVNAETSVFVK